MTSLKADCHVTTRLHVASQTRLAILESGNFKLERRQMYSFSYSITFIVVGFTVGAIAVTILALVRMAINKLSGNSIPTQQIFGSYCKIIGLIMLVAFGLQPILFPNADQQFQALSSLPSQKIIAAFWNAVIGIIPGGFLFLIGRGLSATELPETE
jgi:hypothetical protein